ncbi:MAG: 4Fe-4S dicluster domain-containing protein [Syntrophobacteraceae bacterium]|jgi:ferredoxin
MSGKIYISRDGLAAAMEKLSRTMDVWTPAASAKDKWGVEFALYEPGVKPILDRQSTLSPKKTIFPQVEPLFQFERSKDPEDPSKTLIRLKDRPDAKPAIIFGAHPCDARGFFTFDKVFMEGPYKDPIYTDKREKTVIASVVCRECDDACFCSAVGGGPAEKEGSDIWITPVEDGYVLEAITPKGEPVLEGLGAAATSQQEAAAAKVQEESAQQVVAGGMKMTGETAEFMKHFEDKAFWQSAIAGCISCGVCTFVCPTCYCFTITDEARDTEGDRLRSWDSCMFYHYTLEASGHNPRPNNTDRYRNRLGHKFAYFPEKYDGMIACTGCGRCIRNCPASINIWKIAQSLKEQADACK